MHKFIDPTLNHYIEKLDFCSSHSIIHEWLSDFPSGTKVLDVGTATGVMGKKCQDYGFYLKGIEPIKDYADQAKLYYDEFLCLSLEDAPDEFIEKHDVVICADILEHTTEPYKLLNRLVKLQNPHAHFLISIPNIAYIWVRLNLLIGKFNYADYGILDRTHLRFFTKHTFLELLRLSHLRPVEIRYTPLPLSRVAPFLQTNIIGRIIDRISIKLANLWPGLFAYQFVARAEIVQSEVED